MASKQKNKARPSSIDTLEEQNQIEEQLLAPAAWEEEWQKSCAIDSRMDFFDKVSLIPEGQARERECLIYLYRTHPEVANAPGKPKYIGKYTVPLTQETIQREHGGGGYKLMLKRGPRTLLEATIGIDGEPLYKSGQTTRDGRPLPNAPPSGGGGSGKSDVAEAIAAVGKMVADLSGNQKAVDSSVKIMETGFTSALKAQSDAAAASASSPTGSKVGDSLLPALSKVLERALEPREPAAVVNPLESVEKVFNIVSKLYAKNEPAGEALDPLEQLNFVEKLTGKSFKDLLSPGRKGVEDSPWIPIAGAVVQALPMLFAQFRQMRDEDRRWQIWMMQNGLMPAALPAAPAVAPGNAATPATRTPVGAAGVPSHPPGAPVGQVLAPGAPPPAPPPTQEQLISTVIGEIVKYFTNKFDGYACAAHLIMDLPEAMPLLGPILGDRAQLNNLIEQVPILKQLSQQQPEWDFFLNGFVETLTGESQEEDEEDEGAGDAAPSGQVAPGESAQPTPPQKRRKTVGVN